MKSIKMKQILKYGFAVLLVATFSNACTNLDTPVYGELTSDNFPKTEEQFISALGATYASLQSFGSHNSYWSGQMVSSDLAMIPQRGADWFDGGQWLRSHRHEFAAEGDANINNTWSDLYGGVNNCNRVIELFESLVEDGSVTAEDAAAFIGEVKTLRAYFYLLLMDTFGNVPIVTSFSGGDAAPPTRSRTELFSFVEKELSENVPNLTKANDGTTYGRWNYWAGKALQCRLFLNAEVYTGSPRWQSAIAAADEIIDEQLYVLEGDYFANFAVDNGGSGENIFVVPYDNTQNSGFNWVQMTLHYSSQETFNTIDQPWNGYCSLQEFYNSFDDSDIRKGESGNLGVRGVFLAGPQFKADGITRIIDVNAEPNDPDGQEVNFTPEINEHFPGTFRQAGVRIWKYEYENGTVNTMNNDFVLFRYGEVLLNKAEAEWRMNGGSAGLDYINMLRQRSGLADLAAMTPEDVLAERGRELCFEGLRRQDLIRFQVWADEWDFKPISSENKRIFPIPQEQLNANPNLVQNPGY
jgi:starch-binding outer membrane protein, SusD/RagB family